MSLAAGRLRHVLEVVRTRTVAGPDGPTPAGDPDRHDLWFALEGQPGDEVDRGGEAQHDVSLKIELRAGEDLREQDRVIYNGWTWRVASIYDPDGRGSKWHAILQREPKACA